MKNAIAAVFCFCCFHLFSQGLTHSTIRQVFDFHPGDTLEFETNYLIGGYTLCQKEGYYFDVYLSRQDGQDSIAYTCRSVGFDYYYPTSCSFQTGSSGVNIHTALYTYLDSSIFYYHTHTLGCDTTQFCYNDTSYIDTSSYNGRKIDRHTEGIRIAFSYDTTFADGLGQVEAGFGSEDNTQAQGGYGLVYYHLASGEVWGTPYYFNLYTGIQSPAGDLTVSVTPDPVTDVLRVSVRESSALPVSFSLCDAMGRVVLSKTLSSPTTDITRDGIAEGLYFWNLSIESADRRSFGKIIVK